MDVKVQGLQVRPDLRICHDRLKCIFNAEGTLNANWTPDRKKIQQREEEQIKLDAGYPERPTISFKHMAAPLIDVFNGNINGENTRCIEFS